MKLRLVSLIVAWMVFGLLLGGIGRAADVTVAWDIVEPTCATYVYGSETSMAYAMNFPVARAEPGVNQVTISDLTPGVKYYFVCTHYEDSSGLESGLSTELSYDTPPVENTKTITPLSEVVIMEPTNIVEF